MAEASPAVKRDEGDVAAIRAGAISRSTTLVPQKLAGRVGNRAGARLGTIESATSWQFMRSGAWSRKAGRETGSKSVAQGRTDTFAAGSFTLPRSPVVFDRVHRFSISGMPPIG